MSPPSSARASVTVSIVSHGHGNKGHIEPLLEQLSAWCGPWIERIVLTLNIPEEVHIAPGLAFPVDVVRNARPQGFAVNNNAAFARCGTPWFLVLNPDIRIEQDAIGSLLASADSQAGLIAPRVREPGRSQPEPYRSLVTPVELIRRRRPGHTPPLLPNWIAGMFMLLRASAFSQLGGFDERFFLYCEDVDLCLRLQLAGWKLQVATDLVVHHEAQRDSHSSPRALAWHLSGLARLWTSRTFWKYVGVQHRLQAVQLRP